MTVGLLSLVMCLPRCSRLVILVIGNLVVVVTVRSAGVGLLRCVSLCLICRIVESVCIIDLGRCMTWFRLSSVRLTVRWTYYAVQAEKWKLCLGLKCEIVCSSLRPFLVTRLDSVSLCFVQLCVVVMISCRPVLTRCRCVVVLLLWVVCVMWRLLLVLSSVTRVTLV